jgi:hypothetical protein
MTDLNRNLTDNHFQRRFGAALAAATPSTANRTRGLLILLVFQFFVLQLILSLSQQLSKIQPTLLQLLVRALRLNQTLIKI